MTGSQETESDDRFLESMFESPLQKGITHTERIRVIYARLFRIGRARKNEIFADLVRLEGPVDFNITRTYFWLQMIHYTAAKEGIPLGMPELQTSRDEHWCTFQGFSETHTFRHMCLRDETIIFKHFSPSLLASAATKATFHAPDLRPLPNVVYVFNDQAT